MTPPTVILIELLVLTRFLISCKSDFMYISLPSNTSAELHHQNAAAEFLKNLKTPQLHMDAHLTAHANPAAALLGKHRVAAMADIEAKLLQAHQNHTGPGTSSSGQTVVSHSHSRSSSHGDGSSNIESSSLTHTEMTKTENGKKVASNVEHSATISINDNDKNSTNLESVLTSNNKNNSIGAEIIHGDGKLVNATRKIVGKFSTLEVEGLVHLRVIQGNATPVYLQAEENILPFVDIAMLAQNGSRILRIRMKPGTFEPTIPINAFIRISVAPRKIHCRGSAVVNFEGKLRSAAAIELVANESSVFRAQEISAPEIDLLVEGSAKMELISGSTRKLKCLVANAGRLNAANLKAENVTAVISEAAEATVNADVSIKASASGSAHLKYAGAAKLTAVKGAVSQITRLDAVV